MTGRVTALAFGQDNSGTPAMFLGAASGGVWRSTDFMNAQPTWTPLTDFAGLNVPGGINRQTGLGAGAIDVGAIAVDPNNPKTIYVGTGEATYGASQSRYGSGLLRSTDGGNTFQLVSSGPSFLGIDGGQPQFYRRAFNKIIIDPFNTNILFASVTYSGDRRIFIVNPWPTPPGPIWNTYLGRGIFKGVWNSMTNTFDWTQVTGDGRIGQDITVTDLEYTYSSTSEFLNPGTGFYLYAGVWAADPLAMADNNGSGVWISNDLGNSWHRVTSPPAPAGFVRGIGRVSLATSHIDESWTVYAAIANNSDGLLRDVFRYDGTTWTSVGKPAGQIDTLRQAFLPLGMSPTSGRVYLGAVIPRGSTVGAAEYDPAAAGGATWRTIVPSNQAAICPHTDFCTFAFFQNQVYAGNDGGIWRYNPAPAGLGTWNDLNDSPNGTPIRSRLQTLQVYSVAINPFNGDKMIEGAQDNAFGIGNGTGGYWDSRETGDGVGVFYDPHEFAFTYAYFVDQEGLVWKYTDPGTDQEQSTVISSGNETDYPFYTAFAVNPARVHYIVEATKWGVYESGNQGRTWSYPRLNGSNNWPSDEITSITYGPRIWQPNRQTYWDIFYVTTRDGRAYYFSKYPQTPDAQGRQGTWSRLGTGGDWGADKTISKLIVDRFHPWDSANPNNSGYLYVALSNFDGPQIWQSRNGGRSFQQITGNRWVPTDPNLANRYVVGDNGLPNVPVQTLLLDPRRGRPTLYAGTDMGVYRGTFDGTNWSWSRFDDTGPNSDRLPYVQVRDLQLRGDQLYAATFGRGVWKDTAPVPLALNPGLSVSPATYDLAYNQPSYIPPAGILQDDTTDAAGGLVVTAVNGNTNAVGNPITTNHGGTLTVTADGSLQYVPPTGGYLGDETFTVNVTDGVSTATETVTVHLVDTSCWPSEYSTMTNQSLQVATGADGLLGNASAYSGNSLSIKAVNGSAAAVGTAVSTASGGTLTVQADGSFSYTPLAGYVGDDTFTFTIGDGVSSATATAVVHVVNVYANEAPYDTLHDQTLTAPANGNFGLLFYAGAAAGVPVVGSDVFSYTVSDGVTSNTANCIIHITQATTTDLTTSVNPSSQSQPVTFTATVSATGTPLGGLPTGTVEFLDGLGSNNVLGSATLVNGFAIFTTSSLGAGDHTITAWYLGDNTAWYLGDDAYSSSTSPTLTQTVIPAGSSALIYHPTPKAPTRTMLTSSTRYARVGMPVTFTATIAPASSSTYKPTGTVQFWEVDPTTGANIRLLSTTTVDASGHAKLTISSLTRGTHRIKAVYLGDTNFTGSIAFFDETIF
jgi:hypothetical protein